MTIIQLSDGRYFSRWVGVKPLFTPDERLAKQYMFQMQANMDVDKLAQVGYKRVMTVSAIQDQDWHYILNK